MKNVGNSILTIAIVKMVYISGGNASWLSLSVHSIPECSKLLLKSI